MNIPTRALQATLALAIWAVTLPAPTWAGEVPTVETAAAEAVAPRARPWARIDKALLDGAQVKIAVPETWNGHLLLFAHGFRPLQAPRAARLRLRRPTYRELLNEGWMIATTSYRRNGLIVRDAIIDLDLLRTYIETTYGEPNFVVIQGHSMGGLIGTLLAERQEQPYDAVLAVGAALSLREDEAPMEPTHVPNVPLFFLSNRDEILGPTLYVRRATLQGANPSPILERVDRDGHVNVTDAEIRDALRALIDWAKEGKRP